MSCKHLTIAGKTTKYYYCQVFNKAVDEYKCRDCMLKIENQADVINELFGGFKNGKNIR